MKKLIAMLLCFAMVVAFGASAAFAAMPDPNSAAYWANNARGAGNSAKTMERSDKAVEKAVAAMKAYEAVKYDSSKTKDQVDKAYDKVVGVFKEVGLSWLDPNNVTSSSVAKLNNYSYARQPYSGLKDYDGWKWSEIYKILQAKYDIQSAYWQSSGTKMDVNARDIGLAKIDAAVKLEHAQAAAANAKVGALKAQATAKALIADSIKVAQDAAATAIANAQAEAYSTLASNYADAVEAFWGEVALAWGF